MRLTKAVLAVALLAWLSWPTLAAERVALVVGNSAYSGLAKLRNPRNDAEDMAGKLAELGFDVIKGIDVDANGFRRKLSEFGHAAESAEVALFYYAGHGVQVNDVNYLIPVDAEIGSIIDVGNYGIDLERVQSNFGARTRTNIMLLDACRDNPYEEKLSRSLSRSATSLGKGLSRVRSPRATFIAFATEPDSVAADGAGRNSPFTAALLKHIGKPGKSISEMMIDVRGDVVEATDGKQIPWDSSSLTRHFSFTDATGADEGNIVEAFSIARSFASVVAWQAFVEQFKTDPNGQFFVRMANEELARLSQASKDADIHTPTAQPKAPVAALDVSGLKPLEGGKFTHRLKADGTETDAGVSTSGGFGEGTSVASAASTLSEPPLPRPRGVFGGSMEAFFKSLQPAATGDPANVAVAQRAIYYEERTNVAQGSADTGSIVWSVVQESPGGDLPPEPAIRAQATIPAKNLQFTMTIRRNGDRTLPFSHMIELIFLTPENFDGGGIDNILRFALKESEEAAGTSIIGTPAKIGPDFFLVALNDAPAEVEANLTMLRGQQWIDIPLIYKSGRRALLTIQKGVPGGQVFDHVITGWEATRRG